MSTTEMSERIGIAVTVNGTRYEREVEPRLLLVQLLREELRLTGTHIGCDTSYCGACTILLDGEPVKSCTMLAVQADGGGSFSDGLLFESQLDAGTLVNMGIHSSTVW